MDKYELPDGARIIPGTWAFKCKHFTDGGYQKFKARLCVRGYIYKRIYNVPMHTFAPLLQWSTVKLILVLTCIMVLKTQATDFRNDFD